MDSMTEEANNSSVQLEIFDQVFNLRTDPERGIDPDYILKLAQYVNSKMRFVADENPHVTDSASLGVLAALNIADEYHRLKTKLEGGEKETSGKEEITEEAGSSDSLVEELGQMRKPFTEEDRQRNRERRQRHYTKRRYEKDLLAIVNDESVPAQERHEALFTLGRLRGYHRLRHPSDSSSRKSRFRVAPIYCTVHCTVTAQQYPWGETVFNDTHALS